MARNPLSFDTVRRIGLGLPEVEEGTAWGAPALKVAGKMFACIASHRSAEPATLVVRVPFGARDEMIAADPETYYLEEHYQGYACVLVRPKQVREDALRDLLLMGHRFVKSTTDSGSVPRVRRPAHKSPQKR
ncbi:MAG TPA: MmcQ/YjbR family DNA-binding protein [Vicinamibacterales bacterium]|nr:MmcQ/YjbR family DNA-binding protein [Vicinamibacterales bacterium]